MTDNPNVQDLAKRVADLKDELNSDMDLRDKAEKLYREACEEANRTTTHLKNAREALNKALDS